MVSTASRVGTGNIVSVANAITIGRYGAVFWMWLIASSAALRLSSSTLARICKAQRQGRQLRRPGVLYPVRDRQPRSRCRRGALIATYAFGFNLLASFNLIDSMSTISFYDTFVTASGLASSAGDHRRRARFSSASASARRRQPHRQRSREACSCRSWSVLRIASRRSK